MTGRGHVRSAVHRQGREGHTWPTRRATTSACSDLHAAQRLRDLDDMNSARRGRGRSCRQAHRVRPGEVLRLHGQRRARDGAHQDGPVVRGSRDALPRPDRPPHRQRSRWAQHLHARFAARRASLAVTCSCSPRLGQHVSGSSVIDGPGRLRPVDVAGRPDRRGRGTTADRQPQRQRCRTAPSGRAAPAGAAQA